MPYADQLCFATKHHSLKRLAGKSTVLTAHTQSACTEICAWRRPAWCGGCTITALNEDHIVLVRFLFGLQEILMCQRMSNATYSFSTVHAPLPGTACGKGEDAALV
jgi:hypothetical protein